MDANYVKLAKIVELMKKFDGCTHEIESVLDSGYEINYAVPVDSPLKSYHGYTLLHFAADSKTHENDKVVEVISLLLERNANFTLKDKRNFTPLRLAFDVFVKSERQYLNLIFIVERLLNAHYTLDNSVNEYSDDGISHLHIACAFQNVNVAKLFLKSGVPANEAINSDSSILPGFTCMHIAMATKHKDMVHLLLEHGADHNCLNAEQMSPLHLINEKKLSKGLFERVSVQFNVKEFQKNERILQLITRPSEDNFSPLYDIGLTRLHALCIRNHSATELDDLEKALKENDDVNAAVNLDSPIWPGQSPLHFACHCNLKMVLLLLKNGADLMAEDAKDITPLDLCLENFGPSDIAKILKTQKNFESIKFQNDAPLVETLIAFDNTLKLDEHLETFDLKTTIPVDSPIWPGFSLLHIAVILSQGGDRTKVNLCLEYDTDVTIQDANGMTALHLAFRKEKWSIVDMLLICPDSCGNSVDHKNLSLFHVASIAGNTKRVTSFLDSKVDPNVSIPENLKFSHPDKGLVELPAKSTPLHVAVALQNKSLAKLLLKHKADPFILDADNFTCIHRAFLNGSSSFFSEIFWLFPEVLKSNPVATGGLSHFHVVCSGGTLKAVKALLPLTSNINEPLTDELMKYSKDDPELMFFGQTALHLAVENTAVNKLQFLLKNGADVQAKNSNGLSPLYIALQRKERSIIKLMASESCKNKNWPDENGITLLHLACASGKSSLIKTFSKMEDDVNKRISLDSPVWPGESPIYIAWKFNEFSFTKLLQQFVKSIDIPSDDQELHGSVKRQRIQLPKERLIINSEGLTAFHVSCGTDKPDIVEKFIKLGVDIDAPTDYLATTDAGFSPLHFAVKYGGDHVLETLLKHGANISSENLSGYTPVQLAAAKHSRKLEIFLRSCDVNVEMKTTAGKTLLDLLMDNNYQIYKSYSELLKRGAAENISSFTTTRLVDKLMHVYSGTDFSSLLKYIPNVTDVDDDGRNVIHRLDMMEGALFSLKSFSGNIESLVEHGCKLDLQDHHGKTPLHYAAGRNSKKFETLILSGADVCITDFNGQTPYAILLKKYMNLWSNLLELPMLKHIRKIVATGLDPTIRNIIQNNRDVINISGYEEYLDTSKESLVLSSMKQINITESFVLRNVFAEKMVMEFPVMPSHQREAIVSYLEVSNVVQERFPDWLPLYKMQIRRAKKREESFESTFASLRDILDPRLPDHVLESILVCLSTRDWNNVSNAASSA